MKATSQGIADAALGMVGTPFKHRGRKPGVALDCVGVVLCAVWSAGCDLPDCIGYGPLPKADYLLQELGKRAKRIAWTSAHAGDVLLFEHRGNDPMHFGILVHGDAVVHARRAAGKVIKEHLSEPLRMKVHSIWRPEGING